jgi:hypothetical protein
MGTYKIKTIVVFANKSFIGEAHQKAMQLLPDLTTEIFVAPLNGWSTFYVFPDGSKEGWEDEIEFDHSRFLLKEWINEQASPQLGSPVKFAEIVFDEGEADVFISSTNFIKNNS